MKFSAFLLLLRLLPSPRLFPYTTLFRSGSASVTPFPTDRIVTVLGGTGPQGRGLARRFAAAGIPVVIGSRDADRAAALATELATATGGTVSGADNATAADQGDVVVVSVPWEGHRDLLAGLAPQLVGKVVVDCVNPLGFDTQGAYALAVEEGSAAEQAAALLPDSTVVGAVHNVSAVLLDDPDVDKGGTDGRVLGGVREAAGRVQGVAAAGHG